MPMEVMGLMLGDFVDEYTVKVTDVFAMPQSGTGVSVEAVDDVFQAKMMDLLKQCGRPEMVVGWYHSHPGFGCWLSSVDVNTQQSFESLTQRAVAVVVDPIQSVKGKVVIDAFRTIPPEALMLAKEPRQTTSNIGHLNKPSIQALIHGLNRHYYSLAIAYRKNDLEERMLMNLNKQNWTYGLRVPSSTYTTTTASATQAARTITHNKNQQLVQDLVRLAKAYNKSVHEEVQGLLTEDEMKIRHVGKQDPKRHLVDCVDKVMADNVQHVLTTMLDVGAF